MSWRTVVISNTAKLDLKMGYLVVRQSQTTRIRIAEIATLIIETTAVSISAPLMNELVKNKVKVIFCDEKRNPSFELLPYYGSHDCSLKIREQIKWTQDIKDLVWTEIIREKITNQMRHLQDLNYSEYEMLANYLKELTLGDKTNREGHAAKVYFNSLFGKRFSRDDNNSINASLNYGYSLILSAFNREIVADGYLTQIGLFHDNVFNQFNLASDLMEPFRPLVDRIVKEMKPDKFDKEEKVELLKVFQVEVTINGRTENVNNAIKIYCHSVFNAIEKNDLSLLKFYR